MLVGFATDQVAELNHGILRLVVLLLQSVLGTLLAVNCHRLAILGESSCKITWGKREAVFTLCEIAFGVLGVLGLALPSLVMFPFLAFGGVETYWVAMALPALG